jgi:hypothetical protein
MTRHVVFLAAVGVVMSLFLLGCRIRDPTENEDFLAIHNELATPVRVAYCKDLRCNDFWWHDDVSAYSNSSDSVGADPGTRGFFLIEASRSSGGRCILIVRYTKAHPRLVVSPAALRTCSK